MKNILSTFVLMFAIASVWGQVTFQQGFENTTFPPDNWRIEREDPLAIANWLRNIASPRPGSIGYARHSEPPSFEPSLTNWLITEAIEIPSTDIYELAFWSRWASPVDNGYTGVWISTTTSEIEEFQELHALVPVTGVHTFWSEFAVSLEEFSGQTVYLAFKFTSRPTGFFGTSWDIDDITIQKAPLRIISQTPENSTTDVALNQDIVVRFNIDVTHTDLANIAIYPAVKNFTPSLTDNRTLTITHDGFDYATVYQITIPGGTIVDLNDTISWSFRTVPFCGDAITELPWSEDFEATLFPPDCWKIYSEVADISATWIRTALTQRPGSLGSARHTAPVLVQDVQTSWLITPAIKLPDVGVHELTFWTRWTAGNNNGYTGIWISTTTNEITAFEEWQVLTPLGSGWHEIILSLNEFYGETIYLAFKYESRGVGLGSTAWDIDEVVVQETPIRIVSQTPANNAIDVEINQDIVIVFDHDVSSTNLVNITVNPAVAGGITPSFTDARTLTVTHGGLAHATVYTVTIPEGTLDGFDGEISWSFRTEFSHEVGVVAINQPSAISFGLGNAETVQVTVENFGTSEITSLPIVLMLGETIVATETITTAIPSGEQLVFSFETTVDLSALTDHQITVFTNLEADAYRGNDTLRRSVSNVATATVPFFEGFETTTARNLPRGWTTAGSWITTPELDGQVQLVPHSGERMLFANWDFSAFGGWLFSGQIALTEDITYNIEFYFVAPGFPPASEPDNLFVYIGEEATPDIATTGTLIFEQVGYLEGVEAWASATYQFTPSASGYFYLAFNAPTTGRNTGNRIMIDDISIEVAEEDDPGTGIQILNPTAFVIYPNPVDDILRIETTETLKHIEIFNVQGTLVMTADGNATAVNVSNLPSGVYVIRFVTEMGVSVQRFVKR